MLFYPDQFFYANGPQGGSRRSRHHGGRHSARHDSHDDDDVPAWFGQSRFGQSRGASPWSRAPRQQQVPDEYVVLDEDELNALRAFREAKRRTSQREQYEQQQAARRRAEVERKAREAARREAEARMRAQVEANARAAAREYLRRQQARQQAILEAQQAERQRQQQYLMEQLRQQFGLFAVPTSDSFEGEEQADDVVQRQLQQQREQQEQQDAGTDSAEAAAVQSQLDAACAQATEEAGAARAGSEQPRDQREAYDPIRRLIEALAPYPFVIATESSDEEEAKENQEQEEESGDADQTAAPFEFVVEPDTPIEGPTCETASDDSEPVYVEEPEFRVYSAEPPIPVEYDSGEEAPSLKDRRKERQTSAPVDHLKKAKTKESRRAAKKDAKKERKVQKQQQQQQQQQQARSSKSEAVKQPSGPEISGLLSALADELKRLQDAYVRLSNAKPTGDLREVISRLEAVKIGYSRSEEIYNKLDEVRAPKEERKLKHEITTESVALADKYEELLNAVYAEKKDVSAKNSRSPSPDGGASAAAGAAAAGADSPPKHEVVLEEVQDESD